MPTPSNADLKEANASLKNQLQEMKQLHTSDATKMQDMMEKIETLLAQNASLQQQLATAANPATNDDTSHASEMQETPAAV